MKFTKENAYEELVKQMTAKGEKLNLSERSINEQIESLMPLVANDDTELDDFVTKVLPLFKTADNNVRNDVSVGINKYKEENPPQVKTPNTQETHKEDKSDLEKRLEAMEKEINERKRSEMVASTRSQILEKMKEKGVKNNEWAKALVDEITITEDFDVDAKVESYVSLYNKTVAAVGGDATPHSTGGSGKSDYNNDVIAQAAQKIKAQQLQ